jgi:alginate O-acetyltransferase complex protein AlgI
MLFTSNYFLIFLLLSFCIYWFLPRKAVIQNLFLVLASYTFYCYYEWHYVLLLIVITHFSFFYSPLISKARSDKRKKLLLTLAVTVYLAFLFYFKYLNFFGGIWNDLLGLTGAGHPMFHLLHLVLPLGISFYTLHMMGYSIDMYYESMEPVTDYPAFMAGAVFFPSLSSGPIERAGHIVPQFRAPRKFSLELFEDGINQMLYGIFKKVVIADSLSILVDYVYARYTMLPASAILIGFVAYSIQLYFDFSGYSDIAIGLGKVFGIRLLTNFQFPYFATSMSALWRRWHISLTTWIMTYIFNPIAYTYRKKKKAGIFYAAVVAFLLSGLWHGANWTFVVWGLIHGSIIGYELITVNTRNHLAAKMPRGLYMVSSALLTFIIWTLVLTIFRSDSLSQTADIYHSLFTKGGFFLSPGFSVLFLLLGFAFLVIEWFMKGKEYGLQMASYPNYVRWTVYAILILSFVTSDNFYHTKAFLYFNY